MSQFISTILFSLSITGPIFIVLSIGIILGRKKTIDDNFIETGSKLVFNITLPTLLFISISQADFKQSANISLIGTGLVVTFASWILLEFLGRFFIAQRQDRGVVIQGGFRSNMGIFGLAYCVNAYGSSGLVAASLYLAVVTILFNILSVISLNRAMSNNLSLKQTCIGIIKNPLVLSILAALPLSYYEINLPGFAVKAGEYFANMTLPLALLCIGASLDFKELKGNHRATLIACVSKLVIVPFMMVLCGIFVGLRGLELGVLLLMSSAPTAAVSYVMVRSLGGNAALAANIIALTTIGSLLSTSLAVTLLSQLQLI